MPHPSRLIVYGTDNKPIAGPNPIADKEISNLTGSDIHEFSHEVYTVRKDYLYALLYGIDSVRMHRPLAVVKPVDMMSIPLMSFFVRSTFLPRIEVRWYHNENDKNSYVEYMRMTLEHVRVDSIDYKMYNVNDSAYEHYSHLETVSFCYQKITWWHLNGNLLYTDIWNGGFFSEEDEKDFLGKKVVETLEDAVALKNTFSVVFTRGVFVKPDAGFMFDKKATVTFTSKLNRKPDMNESKVFAKLYAVYNGKTEDMCQITEGRLGNDGSWTTEFTLRKPSAYVNDAARKKDAAATYYAEIENNHAQGKFRSEKQNVPDTGTKKTEIRLVDDADKPCAGIEVSILKNDAPFSNAVSDAQGIVLFELDDPSATYSLSLCEKRAA